MKTLLEASEFKPQRLETLNEPGAILLGFPVAGTTYLSRWFFDGFAVKCVCGTNIQ